MALRWGLCVLLAGLAACDVNTLGEWDPVRCSNGIDDDHDGLIDCDDPDCWAFACDKPSNDQPMDAAVDASRPISDAGSSRDKDAQTDSSILPPPPPPPPDDDSGMMSIEDASMPPASCANGGMSCPSGSSCMNGVCNPDSIAGDYTLQIVSAVVPQRTVTGVCFDFDMLCPPLGSCDECMPDPFVVVLKNGVGMVGTASHVLNTTTPMWSDAKFSLSLSQGDRLEFDVWDWDPLINTRMFTCVPDLTGIASGKLQCGPRSGMTIAPGNDGPYGVAATIERTKK
ncbi:MAG TPA: hypothetical protein VGI70_12890 [Polyangiales bacterium]|jgi:hypothetical protein